MIMHRINYNCQSRSPPAASQFLHTYGLLTVQINFLVILFS